MTREDFDALRIRHQQLLVQFLNSEIDLGLTFASLGNARSAAEAASTIERLATGVEDSEERQEIEERVAGLKSAISR